MAITDVSKSTENKLKKNSLLWWCCFPLGKQPLFKCFFPSNNKGKCYTRIYIRIRVLLCRVAVPCHGQLPLTILLPSAAHTVGEAALFQPVLLIFSCLDALPSNQQHRSNAHVLQRTSAPQPLCALNEMSCKLLQKVITHGTLLQCPTAATFPGAECSSPLNVHPMQCCALQPCAWHGDTCVPHPMTHWQQQSSAQVSHTASPHLGHPKEAHQNQLLLSAGSTRLCSQPQHQL